MEKSSTVLISIKPYWVEELIGGRKKFELRRRPPNIKERTPALIYETAPGSCLRARCQIENVLSGDLDRIWEQTSHASCVTRKEFVSYFAGMHRAHALSISSVHVLRKPIPLHDLRGLTGFVVPQSWSWANSSLLDFVEGCR